MKLFQPMLTQHNHTLNWSEVELQLQRLQIIFWLRRRVAREGDGSKHTGRSQNTIHPTGMNPAYRFIPLSNTSFHPRDQAHGRKLPNEPSELFDVLWGEVQMLGAFRRWFGERGIG